MRMVDLIEKKRDGGELSSTEIEWCINQVTNQTIPDYQIAAFLMAVYLQGMTRAETVTLTLAMARSGQQLDLHDVVPFVVDKHSSGGVGDKTTLTVLPLVAACGVPVGKMSGRGLGASGGTLDKMESIQGWSPNLSLERFKAQLDDIGLVLAGQTSDLAPADGILYALRDVTGTVSSIPLIAASIMSKKLAAGADAIVLDVKVGSGAFMRTLDEGRQLAQVMVDIGVDAGRKMTALLSDMNQPLGRAVGNALEVKEAIATLRGTGPERFWEHCLSVASHMLLLARRVGSEAEARTLLTMIRDEGQALAKFRAMVVAQGGEPKQIDDPSLLPQAEYVETVTSPRSGTIATMDTMALGWVAVRLGAGRQKKGEPIDHAVGYEIYAQVGDWIEKGAPLVTVHAKNPADLEEARAKILGALRWSAENIPALPHIYEIIEG